MSTQNKMSVRFQSKTRRKYFLGLLLLFVSINSVWAAGPPLKSSLTNPLVVSFVVLMLLLLLIIALLANVLLGTLKFYQEKEKSEGKVLPLIISFLFISLQSQAQAASTTYGGLPTTTFILILSVLLIEVVVILFMLLQLKAVLAKEKAQRAITAPTVVKKKESISWWDRLNRFRPAEQEVDIDLGHDYDGIRELDNRLPPWWLWGFYLTILTAGIYLWRFHIVHTAPLSAEEFELSMKAAEARQAEYLKKAANLIDENSVQLVTTDLELTAGKNLFQQNCVACHGKLGEGGVGPNLTDAFWIHGGGLKNIFSSIKYGWQDKGMKSWKEDFTPSQMAQLSSYIYKIQGTNPPNPKAPQGEPYTETAPNGDTTAVSSGVTPKQ